MLREILHYPDPRLRTRAASVAVVDDRIRALIEDMAETMYQAPGIGLAAIQVGVAERVIVVDVSADRNELRAFVNPEILGRDTLGVMEEGCLSVPGVFEEVERAQHVRVRALDATGTPFELEASGLLAVCIQHEIDHLDGKVFIDYLSRLKQQRIRKKLEKQHRLAM
ncbi:MAG TPA: peptide deformylase [Acidiferrobacteraceae bacterium]|nr:peptide deformylase [Acidiferrobacteraceae bacterium]